MHRLQRLCSRVRRGRPATPFTNVGCDQLIAARWRQLAPALSEHLPTGAIISARGSALLDCPDNLMQRIAPQGVVQLPDQDAQGRAVTPAPISR
jgi:hypothetical protein